MVKDFYFGLTSVLYHDWNQSHVRQEIVQRLIETELVIKISVTPHSSLSHMSSIAMLCLLSNFNPLPPPSNNNFIALIKITRMAFLLNYLSFPSFSSTPNFFIITFTSPENYALFMCNLKILL